MNIVKINRKISNLHCNQRGQAFILAVILLVVGTLVIAPLLSFMMTNLNTEMMYEEKRGELYAVDAGIEDAIYRIMHTIDPITNLMGEDEGCSYTVDDINNETVYVTITKRSILYGLLLEDTSPAGHAEWFDVADPIITISSNSTVTNVSGNITLSYSVNGSANKRWLDTLGIYFSPGVADLGSIQDKWSDNISVITDNWLSYDALTSSGGFALIWNWPDQPSQQPEFHQGDSGSMLFGFNIIPNWNLNKAFVFGVLHEDSGYFSTADIEKWQIKATCGDTRVIATVLTEEGTVSLTSWELDPPE